uniref:1,6-anhydro-N-acetylmuramyl-L-alanine amidase AmpD n=1 Tax=uncultured marine virus TaxID=186617 RepID=A0A0F7L7Z9_9VIRU|nr:nucleoside transporter [uncultured marine virus]
MIYKENYIQGNYSKGKIIKPLGVVLHHIYLDRNTIIDLFTNGNVSAHVVIWKDGSRTVFGKDNKRLWHAGKSEFKDKSGCNNFMLGVEFEGNTNIEPLTFNQLSSFQEWFIPRMLKHDIKQDWITTHMRVAPSRKIDISEKEFSKIRNILNNIYEVA